MATGKTEIDMKKKSKNRKIVKNTGSKLDELANIPSYHIPDSQYNGMIVKELQEEIYLSREDMEKVMGVKKSGYYSILGKPVLDPDQVDTLSNFARVWQKGLNTFDFDIDAFNEFLHTKNRNLGGIVPITLINSESGRRELSDAFDRIEYSIYG